MQHPDKYCRLFFHILLSLVYWKQGVMSINCSTHLNPLFLLLSYNACGTLDISWSCKSMVLHWELKQCPCGLWGGKLTTLVTPPPIAGSAVSLSRSTWRGKKKIERRKGGICLPQTSATEHCRSNMLEGFSIACSKHKLILFYDKNKKSTIKQFPQKTHY